MPGYSKAKLLKKEEVAKSTWAFYLEKPKGFKFIPGQYIGISLPKLAKPDPVGPLKSFSMASSPKDKQLLLLMRMRDTGFKQTLNKVRMGSYLAIEGPYGQFTLHEDITRPAVFIAGGVGIAPVRSIVKDATENKLGYKMLLLYSDKTPETITYLDDLKKWQKKNTNFKFSATTTQATGFDYAGRINKKIIHEQTDSLKNPVYYIVGSPDMVYNIKQILKKLKVPEKDIKTEEFAGY